MLGTGILGCYPKENVDLAERIVKYTVTSSRLLAYAAANNYNSPPPKM